MLGKAPFAEEFRVLWPDGSIHWLFGKAEVFYDDDISCLDASESLVARGLLDSLAIIRVVALCENSFAITILDTEILPTHFESIRAIATLVERLRSEQHLTGERS